MQLALPAGSPDHDFSSDDAPSTRRSTKFLVAGIAMASAGVIAVNPVTPTVPDIQERAVQLTAIANPITPWVQTVAGAFDNLGPLTTNSWATSTALAQALSNPAVISQLVGFVGSNAVNPLPLLTQLVNFQSNYGASIDTASQASLTALTTALQKFPTVLQSALTHLATGQFVEFFADVDIFVLVDLLERPGRPLFPLFSIPGDVAAALPGGQIVANVLDAVLTRGTASGLTRALLVAPITAALQTAEILDATRAALQAGDPETAISELLNMPGKVVNAFVNGYVPNFPTRSLFQGLLSENGFFDYFLVDLPKAIATALTLPTTPTATAFTATARTALTPGSPTDVTLNANTVTLGVDTGASTDTSQSTPRADETGSSDTTTVVDTSTDSSGDGTDGGTTDATEGQTDDDSDDGSSTTTDTDTDDGGDTDTGAGSTDSGDDDGTQGADSGASDGDSSGTSGSGTSSGGDSSGGSGGDSSGGSGGDSSGGSE